MIFDIRTPDTAFAFVQEFLNITDSELINEYVIQCNSDFDQFWSRWENYILSIGIDDLKYTVIHVTSNWDKCLEIKTNGIKNLQYVLSEQTEFRAMLLEYGIWFDVKNKILHHGDQTIDIDYQKYRGKCGHSSFEEKIERIAHKVYYDYQVNGFFAHYDVRRYGSHIHLRPEFLYNIGRLLPEMQKIEQTWADKSKGYIITFRCDFEQFAWFTFYDEESVYYDDLLNKQVLKRWMLSHAINRCFDSADGYAEIFAYMGPKTVIRPEQIIDFTEIGEANT